MTQDRKHSESQRDLKVLKIHESSTPQILKETCFQNIPRISNYSNAIKLKLHKLKIDQS